MSKYKNCKSPSGCVHRVAYRCGRRVATKCNHMNYNLHSAFAYEHNWPLTPEPVTCKRCLKLMGELCNCHIGMSYYTPVRKRNVEHSIISFKMAVKNGNKYMRVFKYCPECGGKNDAIKEKR